MGSLAAKYVVSVHQTAIYFSNLLHYDARMSWRRNKSGWAWGPLVLMMQLPAFAADACQQGMEPYVAGDHKKAMKLFEAAAKKGDGCAQFELGLMHYYGHGTKKDEAKAREWLKKSASRGFDKAQMQLAELDKPAEKSN